MKKEIPLAITVVLALLYIFANYFTGNDALASLKASLDTWYLAVQAWAVAIGMVNLAQIHGRRVSQKRDGWFFSLWLMICMFGMLLASLFIFKSAQSDGWKFMYNQLIAPMNATVYATLVFYIGSSAYRSFRMRSMEAGILLVVAAIMMLGRVPLGAMLLGGNPAMGKMADWLLNVPNSAGMRGIQIGACLGGIATALRIMLGIERNWLGGTGE
ncbi:MAG: hypothetical protein ACM3WU_04735 [Bacillota bacterium]